MLSKASVCPNPVCLCRVLNDDFGVDPCVPIRDDSRVVREQAGVDADLCDIEGVRASKEAEAIHKATKCTESTLHDVRAVPYLRGGECVVPNEQARLAYELRDTNDLRR